MIPTSVVKNLCVAKLHIPFKFSELFIISEIQEIQ